MRRTALLFALPLSTVLAALLSFALPEIACAAEKDDLTIDFTDWHKWRIPVDPQRVAEIAAMLDEKPQGIGTPIDDRDFWDRLAKQSATSKPIRQAEKKAKASLPEFSEKLYLDYFEGSKRRQPYENGYRMPIVNGFNCLTIAECLENQGRFLPASNDT